MAAMTLVIGNRNYSSWSLRAWLAVREAGFTFDEIVIPLGEPDTKEQIRKFSPSGRLPVLIDGGCVVWDSLAIAEYVAERTSAAQIWPDDPDARAHARCIAQEMHAGFLALRSAMPMNARAFLPGKGWDGVDRPSLEADLDRVQAIWTDSRTRFGERQPHDEGFLYGRFTIADAAYAPVVLRFATYDVKCDPTSQRYIERILAMPAMREWIEAAKAEPMTMHDKEL